MNPKSGAILPTSKSTNQLTDQMDQWVFHVPNIAVSVNHTFSSFSRGRSHSTKRPYSEACISGSPRTASSRPILWRFKNASSTFTVTSTSAFPIPSSAPSLQSSPFELILKIVKLISQQKKGTLPQRHSRNRVKKSIQQEINTDDWNKIHATGLLSVHIAFGRLIDWLIE